MSKHFHIPIRILVKGISIFLALLIIIMGWQFIIRAQAVDALVGVIIYDPPPPNLRAIISQQLGLDRPFVPDFWPFDEKSLWTNSGQFPSLFSSHSSSIFCSIIVWIELIFFISGIFFLQVRKSANNTGDNTDCKVLPAFSYK